MRAIACLLREMAIGRVTPVWAITREQGLASLQLGMFIQSLIENLLDESIRRGDFRVSIHVLFFSIIVECLPGSHLHESAPNTFELPQTGSPRVN